MVGWIIAVILSAVCWGTADTIFDTVLENQNS